MKIIKYLFFLLLLLIIGGAVFIATKDGAYEVEESYIMEVPNELAFNTINDYKTWEHWGPWMESDPEMNITYAEKTEGEGASYRWESSSEGDGSMKTIKTAPFNTIEQNIEFITPFGESKSDVYWKLEPIDNQKTKVIWGMRGEQSFMEKAYWATQDSTLSQTIKPMYKKGLQNLEAHIKEQMKVYSVKVFGKAEHGGGFYMYSATASSIAAMPTKMEEMFPVVQSYVQNNNLPQTGMPFTIYNEFNPELGTAIYSTAIPVRDRVVTPADSNVLCDFLPRQKIVKVVLKGDYTNLKEAWEAGYKFMEENGLQADPTNVPFEIYQVGLPLEPNPAEWLTEVCIPYQEIDI